MLPRGLLLYRLLAHPRRRRTRTPEAARASGGQARTEGDASAASALAVERFPVANAAGVVTYRRDIRLPEGVTAEDIFDGVIVVHGLASLFEDPTAYDGCAPSSLDPTLPLEATIPVLCGALSAPGSH